MKIFKQTTLVNLLAGLVLSFNVSAQNGLIDDFGLDSDIVEHETDFTCEPLPPPPPPAQQSGAEGLPPLPLPAVPLRRTEKKNPPRPPVLIAKIATNDPADWATNPSDTTNLLRWMSRNLKVDFSSINIPQNQIPEDPKEIPILYRTGHNAFEFTPELRTKLRTYLENGGTLILDACCGRRAFVESALKEIQILFPDRSPYRLTFNHPLYHAYFDLTPEDITYREFARKAGAVNGQTSLVGIDVECRTAVFFFRWDISCGWDGMADSERHHCLGYTMESSRLIGANLMAYISSERQAAMPLSKAMQFVNADKTQAGKFVVAQAKYHGIWKTRQAGLSMLLNAFHEQTKTPVNFEKRDVPLESERLFDVPFLYMTGHRDFTLTEREVQNLRSYLNRGGFLFAESCCGRHGFDTGFRRAMAEVLNGAELLPIPAEHPVYQFPNAVGEVEPRLPVARKLKTENHISPSLQGISIDGRLAVVYSPYGLACGWELAECPYCHGIVSRDALALGVNVLTYALLQ
jgi:hypothetical protein